MNYDYDMEIIMPISFKNKYFLRFLNFCNNGLVNFEHNKIFINFLIGTEQPQNINLKNNIQYEFIDSKLDHPASKVYNFYHSYKEFNRSKWLMRIDDDSKTNIGCLVQFLEHFDFKNEYYFTAEKNVGDIDFTLSFMKECNILEKYISLFKNNFKHEVEIDMFTNSVLQKILNNYKEIIEKRSKVQDGHTDQLFYYLAKLCNIDPKTISVISCENRIQEFLNNELYHVHFIYNSPRCKKMIL